MFSGRHVAALTVVSLSLSGCSILSPIPLWEFAKASGSVASRAMQSAPGEASDTVYHAHAPIAKLCIEYNPQTQTADVVPALQLALRAQKIDSRVYENANITPNCPVWLRYTTQMEWDKSPQSDRFEAYISKAALTLQTDRGVVLSSSYYTVGDGYFAGKWASTQDKLTPVVSALVTGIVPEKLSNQPNKGHS